MSVRQFRVLTHIGNGDGIDDGAGREIPKTQGVGADSEDDFSNCSE